MTTYLTTTTLPEFINAVHRHAVGVDALLDVVTRQGGTTLRKPDNYPPHNTIKYTDDKWGLELAVAGFTRGEISIEVAGHELTVAGKKDPAAVLGEYLHKGIAARDFTKTWSLGDYVEVIGATQRDGILYIDLERKVPEEKKPKQIEITYTK
jgi:molecular chaperone IbpA